MKYWLRRVIFEDIWEQQLEELISLCKRARIDGVLLMEQSHMALMSPYPMEKHRRMAEIYKKIGSALKTAGIRYGINIASLVGHTDMDLPAEYRLGFQSFVGDDLKDTAACYCILGQEWQEYAVEVCNLYAETAPEYLFLDDDFRSLNHGRLLGCFCPVHVAETSKRLGEEITATAILDALRESEYSTQEEKARAKQIRTAWMEANYAGQERAVSKIEEAVHCKFPKVMLGLMSSDELRHSLQGRPIGKLLKTLAGDQPKMLYRPTGAIYGDALHKAVFEGHQRMAVTMGEVDGALHTVSELELFPHTRYSCSRRFSEIMMKTQILAGADDVTLNLYDYLGNPVEREPVWEDMLTANKEYLQKLQQLRKGKKLKGFGLPYRMTESSYHTVKNGDVSSLYPNRNLDILLPSMGIPVQFTEADANAVIGSAVWCYSEEELKRMLSKGFLTDAEGARILEERGLGEYVGCQVQEAGELIPALERLCDARPFAGDIMPTRWNLFKQNERFILEPVAGADVLTTLLDLEKKELGAGTTIYQNSLGGTCAVVAVTPKQETWAFRSRAWLVKEVISRLAENVLPLTISDCPNLGPIYYEDESTGEGLLAVLNGSLDAYCYHIETDRIKLVERLSDSAETSTNSPMTGQLDGISMEIWKTQVADYR